MNIDYNHSQNIHTLEGPHAAFPEVFPAQTPHSLLDVGCGTGTWLKAALEFGVCEIMGVDGVAIPPEQLLLPRDCFRQHDLAQPWDLGRRFDAVLCLEVAEHLDEAHAATLMDTLTRHSDTIVFSAACPGQSGQHHVNCQWPAYWQRMFNERGYVCTDDVRWRIWDKSDVEAWYKQNMFVAHRWPEEAGRERRIQPIVHPEMMPYFQSALREMVIEHIKHGGLAGKWYLALPLRAAWGKMQRRFWQRKDAGSNLQRPARLPHPWHTQPSARTACDACHARGRRNRCLNSDGNCCLPTDSELSDSLR